MVRETDWLGWAGVVMGAIVTAWALATGEGFAAGVGLLALGALIIGIAHRHR